MVCVASAAKARKHASVEMLESSLATVNRKIASNGAGILGEYVQI
jgi:hypothetical protein